MKTKNILFILSAVVVVGGLAFTFMPHIANVAAASSDYLLEIDGIKGSSTASGHAGAIEVASWSFGASNPTSVGSGGMSAGKVSISSFNFMKKSDKASAQLFNAWQSGNHIKTANFRVHLMGSAEYITIHLTDVMVSSYSMSSGGDRPMESVSFAYSKVSIDWPKSLDSSK